MLLLFIIINLSSLSASSICFDSLNDLNSANLVRYPDQYQKRKGSCVLSHYVAGSDSGIKKASRKIILEKLKRIFPHGTYELLESAQSVNGSMLETTPSEATQAILTVIHDGLKERGVSNQGLWLRFHWKRFFDPEKENPDNQTMFISVPFGYEQAIEHTPIFGRYARQHNLIGRFKFIDDSDVGIFSSFEIFSPRIAGAPRWRFGHHEINTFTDIGSNDTPLDVLEIGGIRFLVVDWSKDLPPNYPWKTNGSYQWVPESK